MSIKVTIEIDLNSANKDELVHLAGELIRLAGASDKANFRSGDGIRRQAPPPVNRPRNRKRPPMTGTLAERWEKFYDTMSQRTRDFADLIEAHAPDPVTQARVMDLLEIDEPKTLGGLTGSLNRWSAAVEVQLPWQTINHGGMRAWVWKPLPDDSAHHSDDDEDT